MKIAVVGGGIKGSVVASELTKICENGIDVVLFDQGRRGPGGRASHRSVAKKNLDTSNNNPINDSSIENEEFIVLPDDHIEDSAFQFDHGCKCRKLPNTE